MEWISVEETLPLEGEEVLVVSIFSESSIAMSLTHIALMMGSVWMDPGGEAIESDENRVTHWMPIPELPRYKHKLRKVKLATLKKSEE